MLARIVRSAVLFTDHHVAIRGGHRLIIRLAIDGLGRHVGIDRCAERQLIALLLVGKGERLGFIGQRDSRNVADSRIFDGERFGLQTAGVVGYRQRVGRVDIHHFL